MLHNGSDYVEEQADAHMVNEVAKKTLGKHTRTTFANLWPPVWGLASFSSLPHTHAHTRPSLSGREEGNDRDGKSKKLPRSHQKRQLDEFLHLGHRHRAPLISDVATRLSCP